MSPDYRIALTEVNAWCRVAIPRDKLQFLGAAIVDIRTSFGISAALRQPTELAAMRAIQSVKDMYFGPETKA